jgi:hypothetical protein
MTVASLLLSGKAVADGTLKEGTIKKAKLKLLEKLRADQLNDTETITARLQVQCL